MPQGWQVSAKGGLNQFKPVRQKQVSARFLPLHVNILKTPKFTTFNYYNAPNH